MTLRTGLIITGDTDGAQKALNDLSADMDRAGAAAKGLGAAERVAEAATESLEAELRQARAALSGAVAELNQMREASAALAGRVDLLETQLARASAAGKGHARSMGEQALGARMLGQQFQDMGLMVSMSGLTAESALRAFSMQAGQTALAVEQMGVKGAIGRFAGFMGTPWGSIMLTAGIVLAPLVAKLFETEAAAEAAKVATSGLGEAESDLAALFGKTSSKIAEQNELLLINARIKAANLRLDAAQDAKDAAKAFQQAGQSMYGVPGAEGLMALGIGRGNSAVRDLSARAARAASAQRLTGETDESFAAFQGKVFDQIVKDAQKTSFKGSGTTQSAFLESVSKIVAARANNRIADLIDKSLDGRKIVPELQKPDSGGKKRTPSTAARDEFGRDAADRIASITEAFEDTPSAVRQADKAIRQLDDLIDDLGRKKPVGFEALIASAQTAKQTIDSGLLRSLSDAYKAPETLAEKAAPALGAIADIIQRLSDQKPLGFEKLIADAQAARGVIEDGIVRPYTDFLLTQQQSYDILQLQLRGHLDQAEALRTIIGLERQMGPLADEQKDAILETVQALRAQQRELDILRQDTQKYIDALSSIEGIVRDASQAFVRGDLGQFIKSPGKLLDAFQTLQGQELFDKLFAGVFRDLQDEINGTSIVEAASTRMAGAVDKVTVSTSRTTGALDRLAASADRAAGSVDGGNTLGQGLGADIASAATASLAGIGGSIASLVGALGGAQVGSSTGNGDEIVVTGSRNKTLSSDQLIAKAVGGVGESILKAFTNPDSAKSIGGEIGKYASKGLAGAATGSIVSGISNALGIKMSTPGAQIGGAIGGLLPMIPGGSIIGSIAGGLLGGLFNKPKYGTAQVTGEDPARISGNAGSAKSGAGTLAGAVQSGIQKIAETLGGELGNYKVSIGTFDGKYRVSTTGFTGSLDSKKAKGQGLVDFGKDGADAAISFAIADAIKDGAVTGLSAAVQQALRSNPDIDAALKEALKVADVEQMMGGLRGEIAKAFKDFEKTAAERVRIARQYGFDVVEIEKRNAQDRLNLQKQLMEEQVGSLQRLVDEMTGGSLFEGSAVDQRAALLEQIAATKKDMDAGVAGASDKLATLFEQLNSVSEAVYGTTGGFATDRAAILDQARAAIAKANADIVAAQGKTSDPALAATNAALDENNDQNARMIDALERSNDLLASIAGLGTGRAGVAELARMAKTG